MLTKTTAPKNSRRKQAIKPETVSIAHEDLKRLYTAYVRNDLLDEDVLKRIGDLLR